MAVDDVKSCRLSVGLVCFCFPSEVQFALADEKHVKNIDDMLVLKRSPTHFQRSEYQRDLG